LFWALFDDPVGFGCAKAQAPLPHLRGDVFPTIGALVRSRAISMSWRLHFWQVPTSPSPKCTIYARLAETHYGEHPHESGRQPWLKGDWRRLTLWQRVKRTYSLWGGSYVHPDGTIELELIWTAKRLAWGP